VIAEKRFNNEGEGMKGKGQLLLPQGKFQEVLMKRLAALDGKAEVRIGSSVTGFSQHASSVSVNISDTREETTIEASYLLAADGSHSLIRKALGIPFEGETLDAQLVALDLHFPFSEHGFHDANFIIDPINYGLIGRILPATPPTPALWRVSYGAPLGLSEAEIKDRVDEKLRTMLPNAGRNEDGQIGFEVVRVAPYKAQQLLASTLYTQRVCLVGDAAHLTNPYAGLGLASGIADAASLAMVLEHVLIGKAKDTETLLHAWSEARRQKFSSVVDKPSRMAYKRVRTDVGTDERLQELLSKDPMVGALKKGMPVMPPSLETNGEELEGW
jgi:2-polyprenyl-6-methoxyphenol hydroxylase-like FAD-dependent oxidoreductase